MFLYQIFVCLLITITINPFSPRAIQAINITPTKLAISLDQVSGINLYYHMSSFESTDMSFSLKVKGSTLTDGKKSIPLASIKPLLRSFHDLYPGTRDIMIQRWTDDYPYADVALTLKDGRHILASSSSQYGRLVPWNIQVWPGEFDQPGGPTNVYFLLHDDFHAGLSALWQPLTGENFPRDYGKEQFWWDPKDITETVKFYIPCQNLPDEDCGDKTTVTGSPASVMSPFIPLLKHNSELAQLFNAGYTLFDAGFDVTVTVTNTHPISYDGTIALKSPDGQDVVVSTASIQLEPKLVVDTPLTLQEAQNRITERKSYAYLTKIHEIFPDLVYLLDKREKLHGPDTIDCPENPDVAKTDFTVEAVFTQHNQERIIFYHLSALNAWSLDYGVQRTDQAWNDAFITNILTQWFPPELWQLSPADLQDIGTGLAIGFQPGVTQAKPELIDLLRKVIPPEVNIHIENPQKAGDMTFASGDARVIVPEDNSTPQIVYCGSTPPKWYGAPYNTAGVITPQDEPRADISGWSASSGSWTGTRGLPSGQIGSTDRVNWTTIGESKPGFIHLLWTTDKGVYYSDGWADGSDWSKVQRLGDDSWNMQVVANPEGVVHLIWSTFYPNGTMHVWRKANGEWQKPEFWPGVGYFSQVILDEQGKLHLAWQASDGLDEEFFYASWTEHDGLTQRENISRRIGDIGNYEIRLQIDSQGSVQAVWGHPLGSNPYIDPLSGEVFDQAGIFYSRRLGEQNWTMPEQIGTFGPFAYSMDFILNNQDEPVVAWQTTEGIVASFRQKGQWSNPYLLVSVKPPDTPAEFGPERWGQATAEIQLGKDRTGNIDAAWITNIGGLCLARFDGNTWTAPLQLSAANTYASLKMAVASDGTVHLIYFQNSSLKYTKVVTNNSVSTKGFGIDYSDYGLEENSLLTDESGFVYILGLPRTPRWVTFIPSTWVAPNPTAVPTGTPTSTPTSKPSSTPTISPTPKPTATRSFTVTPTPAPILSPTNPPATVLPSPTASTITRQTSSSPAVPGIIIYAVIVLLAGVALASLKRQ